MKLKLITLFLFVYSTCFAKNDLYANLQYPNIAEAISQLETGRYTSKLCKKYNNLFGMKVGSRNFHYGKTKGGYAKYKSKILSVADYAAYEQRLIRKYNIKNSKQYLSVIGKNMLKIQITKNYYISF